MLTIDVKYFMRQIGLMRSVDLLYMRGGRDRFND